MLLEKLQKFGLTQKEAKIYAALQRLGTSVASTIASRSGINRSTAYVLLESLARRGLIRVLEQGGIRAYSPAPAERFVEIAESSLAKSKSLVEASQELAREFKREGHHASPQPMVQLFEGADGIKAAYEKVLAAGKTWCSYSALSVLEKALPHFLESLNRRQVEKKLPIRIIVPDTPPNRELITIAGRELSEFFLIPQSDYAFDFIVNGNTVAYVCFDQLSAVVIESRAYAVLSEHLFSALLSQARPWHLPRAKKLEAKRRQPRELVKAAQRFFSS